MADVSRAVLSALLWILVSAAEEQKNITAECGQNVTLPCRAPSFGNITVNWSRADLGGEYVLLHRDGHFDPHNQHPSFKNRMDLQDRRMKDGDVSLILINVTINDTGTYECRVFTDEKPSLDHITTINLSVVPGVPDLEPKRRLIIGRPVSAVMFTAIVIFVLCWKHKTKIMYGLKKMYSIFFNGAVDKEEEEETACIAPQRGNSVATAATDIKIHIADNNNVIPRTII